MRYMGPMFYENWSEKRDIDENGNCASTDVQHALNVADRNVRFWYLGGNSRTRGISPGPDIYN